VENEQGPDGLTNKEGAGRPRLITNEQMQELARIVEAGPDPQIDGVVR
jgi:transposase